MKSSDTDVYDVTKEIAKFRKIYRKLLNGVGQSDNPDLAVLENVDAAFDWNDEQILKNRGLNNVMFVLLPSNRIKELATLNKDDVEIITDFIAHKFYSENVEIKNPKLCFMAENHFNSIFWEKCKNLPTNDKGRQTALEELKSPVKVFELKERKIKNPQVVDPEEIAFYHDGQVLEFYANSHLPANMKNEPTTQKSKPTKAPALTA